MAAGASLELQQIETYPLLMDHSVSACRHEDTIPVMPETSGSSNDYRSSYSEGISSSSLGHVAISVDPPSISSSSMQSQRNQAVPTSNSLGRSVSTSSFSQLIPGGRSSQRSRIGSENNGQGTQQRTNPLNSGLWISIDTAITVAQIVAAVIVLCLSRNEKPRAPLAIWVMGYTGGCFALLPFLYWRYKHHQARQQEHDALTSSSSFSTSAPSSPVTLPQQNSQQGGELEGALHSADGHIEEVSGDARTAVYMERFKIALDCFFAVWFVIGNVWIFGGHTSSHDAPNLYRLCIVFLAFSCVSYAMPFIICAAVCCCLPCIITLLSYRDEHTQVKGAAPEVIAGIPVYKFKRNQANGKVCKDGNDSDCDSHGGEGGIFAPGTNKERLVSSEDAVCCICLGQYKDGVDLKELSCSHFFHVECLDKWLKINGSCPLCKHELSVDGSSTSS